MPSASLLTRITFALSVVSASASAVVGGCTDDVADDQGGTNAAGTSGTGGTAAAGSGGTSSTCDRPLPDVSSCRTDADCAAAPTGSRSTCFAPGTSACDGVGSPTDCRADTDCADAQHGGQPGFLCQLFGGIDRSSCGPGCTDDASCAPSLVCDLASKHCVRPSCETSACPEDSYCTAAKQCRYQVCNATRPCAPGFSCSTTDFTCVRTTCTGTITGECPTSFVCNPHSHQCARAACACDTDCDAGGFCVFGQCYPVASHCEGGCGIGRPLILGDGAVVVAPLVRLRFDLPAVGPVIAGWS
jgi:hypothetical protein